MQQLFELQLQSTRSSTYCCFCSRCRHSFVENNIQIDVLPSKRWFKKLSKIFIFCKKILIRKNVHLQIQHQLCTFGFKKKLIASNWCYWLAIYRYCQFKHLLSSITCCSEKDLLNIYCILMIFTTFFDFS